MEVSKTGSTPNTGLTAEQLRELPGLENISEEQARSMIQQIREYGLLVHAVFSSQTNP